MRRNHLSIYTDASFSHLENVASYAFYATLNEKHVRYSNLFTCLVESSNDAEMLALGHALNYILGENLPKLESITIYTDSSTTILEVGKQSTYLGIEINRKWQRLISRTGSKKNKLEHIKAHSNEEDYHSEINDWCDRSAKIELRKRVEEKCKKKNTEVISA